MITRSSLASENNGIPQTGLTLAYKINPFGPSDGRVFITERGRSPLDIPCTFIVPCPSVIQFVSLSVRRS